MDTFQFDYSTKNIPYAKLDSYTRRLIEKTEKFIRSLRWRAYFYLHPEAKSKQKETYGFNSRKTPPVIEEMRTFENRMAETIKNIEFKKCDNSFQQKLKKDLNKIKSEEHLIVKADKTTNYYKMKKTNYNELLNKNIQKDYRKMDASTEKSINEEAKQLAEKIQLEDRVEITAKKDAYITLKDHKPNFQNTPTCRLISPTKAELGRVSKKMLERIINVVRETTQLNLWKSTGEVIEWFKKIPNKNKQAFICFDIVEFYPSISEKLLNQALDYASTYTTISETEREIITHAKKTLLVSGKNTWAKKEAENRMFDVTMGSFDGAETCELVVLYMLSKLQHEYGDGMGLYRDDGLAVSNQSPREIENIKKGICKIFKDSGLRVTIEANKQTIDYLDVTLDLKENIYKPYKKPNNTPQYVNAKSNHPPNVIKAIPEGINKRLSNISSNEKVFLEAVPTYQKALDESGYKYKLEYKPNKETQQKRKRKRAREITWFNPPFDLQVKTNIGKKFFKDLDEAFPEGNKLRGIFNKNTVKFSYSCMPNADSIINSHNRKLLAEEPKPDRKCNCRKNNVCPLQGNCLTENIVYQATVTTDENHDETYVGVTSTPFKTRLANHKQSFNQEKYKQQTELSKYVWTLKDNNSQYQITWKILKQVPPYTNITKKCNLCLMEKWYILTHPEMATLNSRTELINTCRHSDKYLLSRIK